MSKIFLLIFLIGTLYSEDLYRQGDCVNKENLIDMIKSNDLEKLKSSITFSCNLHNENENQETLLFDAVRSSNNEIVTVLLNYGFDINHTNNDGQTVLHVAVKNKYANIVEILMRNGANDTDDNYGYSAKWYAYKFSALQSLEIIKIYEKMKNTQNQDSLDEFINNFHKKPIEEM